MLAATDNGYQADTTSFQSPQRKCWNGMALAILRATEKQGNITLRVSCAGLAPAVLQLKTSR
jgi:beta-galactosidase